MIFLELFFGFLRVGLFAFGGSYGAIALIRDVVLSYGWLSEDMLTYMIAVSESTPGPIMINIATYIGSSQAGILGAAIATLAVTIPSFVIIILITASLKTILQNTYIQAVLSGLKPCIIGIVLATGIFMLFKNSFVDSESIYLTILLSILMFAYHKSFNKKISPILLIIIAAIAGIAVGF